jgi:hypothetical protein
MRRLIAIFPVSILLLAGCGGSGSSSTIASTPTAAPLPGQVKQKVDQAKPALGSPSQIPKGAGVPRFGTEAPANEKAAAAQVLTAYLAALAKGDTETACALLSPILADHLALIASQAHPGKAPSTTPNPAECPAALTSLLPRLPADRRHLSPPRVLSLRSNDGHAIAVFVASGNAYAQPMLGAGTDWKVATLIPAPLG